MTNPDLRQPVPDDEPELIAVRDQAVRSLGHGYGLDGISDACRSAENEYFEGGRDTTAEPLNPSYRSLHALKRKVLAAHRAGYGPEEIGDAIHEAEILFMKTETNGTDW